MKYERIREGRFVSRPNRFIAYIEVDGEVHKCHVKNTGRLKELLPEGVKVFVEENDNPNRKTKYSLIAVMKGDQVVNIDSQAPNKVVYEWLCKEDRIPGLRLIRPEYKYGDSRVDFYLEGEGEHPGEVKKYLIEVKGVTLEDEGVLRFPDAPTERGIKHLKELTKALEDGYETMVLFVLQMNEAKWFEPNPDRPEFCKALKEAHEAGVKVSAFHCAVTADSLELTNPVEVRI